MRSWKLGEYYGQPGSLADLRLATALALLFSLSGCQLAEHEVEQTKNQVSKLSEQVGIDSGAISTAVDGAVTSVSQTYTTHVSPVIGQTDEILEAVEFYHSAKETGSQAVESVKRTCGPIIESGGQLISNMPQSEEELQRLVISYNDDFANMLKGYAGQLNHTRLGGGRGKGLGSLSFSGGRPSYTKPTDVKMHAGGNRHGPTR